MRALEKDGKAQPAQIYLLTMNGGEARALTELAAGCQRPRRGRPTARDRVHELHRRRGHEEADDPKPAPERKSDVKVVTRAVYRANGNPGYVDNDHHAHIFTVCGPTGSTRSRQASAEADDRRRVRRRRHRSGRPTARRSTSSRPGSPSRTTRKSGDELLCASRRPAAPSPRSRASTGGIGNISVSPDGKRIAFVGALRGQPVRSYSQPDLWVTDAAPGSTPKNLTADYDFDISQRHRRRSGRAARAEPQADRLVEAMRPSLLVVSAENGSSNLKRVAIATGRIEPVTDGRARRRRVSARRRTARRSPRRSRRRPTSATSRSSRARSVGDRGSRRVQITHVNDDALRGHPAERAGRDLVHELRRQEDPGLDPEAARLRPVEEVPDDPRDPRRTARGVRQHLHARVPVDGGEGLRRALHQPARQHDLRPGVRQHHSVPLSRRRLQRPDGGRRRSR